MHLVIPIHLSLFWVVCHLSRTFSPKEFEWELQNRLPLSPHRQTNLARYKLVVPEPCACSTSMCVYGLSDVHAFAMTLRLVCMFCYSLLTSCGVDESLSFHSLCLTSLLGWALLDCGLFLL